MPQLGPLEILTVAVVALVVFGPQRLPEIARNIGKAVNEMRRMTAEMRAELREGMSASDADEPGAPDADDPEAPEPAKPVAANPDEQER
ncbi:MAG: Sec-independent protein translocase protein TatB [Actinomycetota bacterium]